MSDEIHSVTWSDGVPTFHCAGDCTSFCHSFPDCDCELWGPDHEHPFVAHDTDCWVLRWLTGAEVECTWIGGEGYYKPAEHDGPIETEWTGDEIQWDYSDVTLFHTSASVASAGSGQQPATDLEENQ